MASVVTRPQVGIERLPSNAARRTGSEQRESMNCKSCRKRKIKCNRLRPTCEACKIFQCPCLYDAIPKKRGPKTDVLEALLKRVDGLEKRLADEKKSHSPTEEVSAGSENTKHSPSSKTSQSSMIDTSINNAEALFSPVTRSVSSPNEANDVMIDAYFLKVHDKPFHILDETTVRQQHHLNQIPQCLRLAIYAVSARFVNTNSGYTTAVRSSEEYATQARALIDVDEPSIEALQSLLLIHRAYFAAGKGRKAYMLLSIAISMAIGLDLHREVPAKAKLTPNERELRRQLFWTCYLMDGFTACGSKRPSLISDNSMILRLPSWIPHPGAMLVEGEYFSIQSNLQHPPGASGLSQGSVGMLIDISRILGTTNRYLANGGVKGDSHFPWHSLSNLSKIRQDLDFWASGNQDIFADINALLAHHDSVILVLSKFVYHVIHCLIYRPFLPVDLAELRGTGQHQSWQIEATNLCFLHANAIAELARVAKQAPGMEWPAFVGYCICTAGTVHVHGAHYKGQEGEAYLPSAQYLSQEMQLLSELRYTWAGIQHQRDTLQTIYVCHSDLVKSLASNPLRFSPVFHLEDFFDRYTGQFFDGAHVTFTDMVVEARHESLAAHDRDKMEYKQGPYFHPGSANLPQQQILTPITPSAPHQPQHRRYTDSAVPPPASDPNDKHTLVSPHLANISEYGNFQAPNGLGVDLPAGFSPSFSFSPLPHGNFDPALFGMPADGNPGHPNTNPNANPNVNAYGYDPNMHGQTAATPGGLSQSGSSHANEEKDPFLTLLEQLAENEHSRGGPSDLDYYLGGQEG